MEKCILGFYFFVFQLLPPIPEPCTSSKNETGEGSMLGERAGFSTGSPWSVTKGFSPALCFLLVMKASPYLADRAALCSSLSLSSALSCPACFLPVVVINFPELYSSKSLEEPFGNGSTPRRLSLICPNKIRYCIYNLTWTFCIQPS